MMYLNILLLSVRVNKLLHIRKRAYTDLCGLIFLFCKRPRINIYATHMRLTDTASRHTKPDTPNVQQIHRTIAPAYQ